MAAPVGQRIRERQASLNQLGHGIGTNKKAAYMEFRMGTAATIAAVPNFVAGLVLQRRLT